MKSKMEEERIVVMCEGKMLRRISGPKSEQKWTIRTKKNCSVYINKLLILDKDVLVRNCSEGNGDKIVKNTFLGMSMEKMQ
jgi:hypothetical protein